MDKLSVNNMGAYVFNYTVQWLATDGTWHTAEWNSGNYPVSQGRTTPELGTLGVPTDALVVTVYGHAVLGTSGQGHAFVQYKPGTNVTGVYNATGTTFINFDISLVN